jgi:hypothetical protein
MVDQGNQKSVFLRSEGNAILSRELHGAEGPRSGSNIPDPEYGLGCFADRIRIGCDKQRQFNRQFRALVGKSSTKASDRNRVSMTDFG